MQVDTAPAGLTVAAAIDRTDTPDSSLAAADALAARAIGWVAPIRLEVAGTEAERQEVYRLRYRAVVERRWRNPEEFPNGMERDEYDDNAVHIVAWDGVTLAATSRLVLPRPGSRLPTEEAFDLVIEPRGRVLDAGRFVVAREYSSMEHRLLATLLAQTWLEVRARGFSLVCAAFASRAMIRVYRQMGLSSSVLGPPRTYWGVERFPILFDVAAAQPALLERWPSAIADAPGG